MTTPTTASSALGLYSYGGRPPGAPRIGIPDESVVPTVSWHVQGMFFGTAHLRLLQRRINLDRYRPAYRAGFLSCGWTGDWRSTTLPFH